MTIPTLRQVLLASPAFLYFIAFFAGLIMFFIFRSVLRLLPGIVHLILGVLVGLGVYYILTHWL